MKPSRNKNILIPSLLTLMTFSIVTLSLTSGYDLRTGRNLPWEAALVLAPSGFVSLAIHRVTGENGTFDFVYDKPALARVTATLGFPENLSYFAIFMQSNIFECIAFALFYSFYSRKKISPKRSALITSLSNSVTHPIVFFGFMSSGMSYFWSVLLAETFAVITETVLHLIALRDEMPVRRVLVSSLCANLVSWQLGPIFTKLWLLVL